MKYNFYKQICLGGVSILRSNHLAQLQKIEEDARSLLMQLAILNGALKSNIKSQIGQDLFALYSLNWKRNGYFVDFGAANGVDLSNSYLLERDFGWTGILAEPAISWQKELLANRNCIIDFDCVWKESDQLMPFTVSNHAHYSTLSKFSKFGFLNKKANPAHQQMVKTISLHDLLERHDAPKIIDLLSIDTEGSEFEILKAFDFSSRTFLVITCEHNYSRQRENIYRLLVGNGYIRVFDGLSRWDDWYVHSSVRGKGRT